MGESWENRGSHGELISVKPQQPEKQPDFARSSWLNFREFSRQESNMVRIV